MKGSKHKESETVETTKKPGRFAKYITKGPDHSQATEFHIEKHDGRHGGWNIVCIGQNGQAYHTNRWINTKREAVEWVEGQIGSRSYKIEKKNTHTAYVIS